MNTNAAHVARQIAAAREQILAFSKHQDMAVSSVRSFIASTHRLRYKHIDTRFLLLFIASAILVQGGCVSTCMSIETGRQLIFKR